MLEIFRLDYLLGCYRKWRGDYRAASRHFEQLSHREPSSACVRKKHLHLLYESGQYERIVELVNELPEASCGLESVRYLFWALLKIQSFEELCERYSKLALSKQDEFEIKLAYGDAFFSLGRLDDAGAVYRELLEAACNERNSARLSELYHLLGCVDELRHANEDSAEKYQKALEYSEDPKVKRLGIGALHRAKGFLVQAEKAYEARLRVMPNDPDLHFALGDVYSAQLKITNAAEAYRKFVLCDHKKPEFDECKIIFDSYMGRNYSCSPRAIYEILLRDKAYKKYSFVWVVGSSSITRYWRLYLNLRTRVVRYKSKEYFRSYASAKYWITNSRISFVHKIDPRQVYVQCWHGTPLKKIGHSLILNTDDVRYDRESLIEMYDFEAKRFDYLISPSKAATEYLSEAFDLDNLGKRASVVETGYPRNDFLLTYQPGYAQRVRARLGIPDDKKIVLYAPTWRDDEHSREAGYTYKIQADFDALRDSLSDEWVILFRAHYFISENFNFDEYKGFVFDVSGVNDINDLYIISDALITDYSSVCFDYAILKRPILFFMYDLERYREKLRGFYFDLDLLPGSIVKTEEEISLILGDLPRYQEKYRDKYEAFLATYNYLDDGQAAKRVVELVWGDRKAS